MLFWISWLPSNTLFRAAGLQPITRRLWDGSKLSLNICVYDYMSVCFLFRAVGLQPITRRLWDGSKLSNICVYDYMSVCFLCLCLLVVQCDCVCGCWTFTRMDPQKVSVEPPLLWNVGLWVDVILSEMNCPLRKELGITTISEYIHKWKCLWNAHLCTHAHVVS